MKLLAPGQLVKINNPDRKGCHNRIGMIISYHIKTDEPPKIKFMYNILINKILIKDTFGEDEFEVMKNEKTIEI